MLLQRLPATTRLRFQALEKISAKSASKKGVQLWMTPPRYRPTALETEMLRSAAATRVRFGGASYQQFAETFYTLYSWGQGPRVLLLHDWGAAAAQVAPLACALARNNYQVLAVDALAHGDSPGSRTDLTELVAVIRDLESQMGAFEAVFAHSWSAIAAVVALNEGVRLRRLVLSNTAASIDFYLGSFSRALGASRQTMGRISASLNHAMKRNIKEFSIINILPGLKTPGLLIHDMKNPVIPVSEAQALSRLCPTCEPYFTSGLGHDGIFTDEAVLAKIMAHIGQGIAADRSARSGVSQNH